MPAAVARLPTMLLAIALLTVVVPASSQTTPVPDVEALDLTAEPAAPHVVDETTFTGTLRNNDEERPAQNVSVAFEVDNETLSQHVVDIPPGETINVTSDAWTAEAGQHHATVEAYAGQDVDEGRPLASPGDHNNVAHLNLTVGPDLVVDAIDPAPASPTEGDQVRFDVTVLNQDDNEDVDESFDVQVTVEDDEGETLFEDTLTLEGLRFGEATTVTTSPWQAVEGQVTVQAIADADDAVPESNETNNDREINLTVEAAQPDLAVTDVTLSPSTPDPGETVAIVAHVANEGTTAIETDVPIRFLVDGSTHGPDVDLEAGEDPLEPGQTRTVESEAWTTSEGRHTLEAIGDPGDQHLPDESDETNNDHTTEVTIGANLVIDEITWDPDPPAQGVDTTLNVTIRNTGTTAVENQTTLRLDIPADGFTGWADTDPLEPGTSITHELGPWTPDEDQTYEIHAHADVNDTAPEVDETDNTRNETVDVTPEAPDLVATSLTLDPAEPAPGDEVRATVTVENQGSSEAGPFEVGFRLDGETLGPNQTVGGPLDPLEPGENTTVTSEPFELDVGQHTVRAIADIGDDVDEVDETNNDARRDVAVGPDLTPTDVLLDPADPEPGDEVDLEAIVANTGTSSAGEHTVRFLVDGDTVGEVTLDGLDAGEEATTDPVTWTATEGAHTVEVVVDPDDAVEEHDEDDNTREESFSTTGTADLTVSSVTHGGQLTAGDQAVFTARVTNTGTAEVDGSITVAFELDGDPLGEATVDGLPVDASATVTSQPWNATTGDHALTVTVDPDDRVQEADEGDNEHARTVTVHPPDADDETDGPGQPNLVLDQLTVPSDAAPGDEVPLLATVTNTGDATAGATTVRFVLDGSTTLGEPSLGELAPGASTRVTTLRWTATAGEHTVTATVDPGDRVAEADEGDNQRRRTFTVTSPAEDEGSPQLAIADVALDPAQPSADDTVTVRVTVRNAGDSAATSLALQVAVDGEPLGDPLRSDTTLLPGESATLLTQWQATSGEHQVTAQVAPRDPAAGSELAPTSQAGDVATLSVEVDDAEAALLPTPGLVVLLASALAAALAAGRARWER